MKLHYWNDLLFGKKLILMHPIKIELVDLFCFVVQPPAASWQQTISSLTLRMLNTKTPIRHFIFMHKISILYHSWLFCSCLFSQTMKTYCSVDHQSSTASRTVSAGSCQQTPLICGIRKYRSWRTVSLIFNQKDKALFSVMDHKLGIGTLDDSKTSKLFF